MSSNTSVRPTIFREYIGGKSFPRFNDFPEKMINTKMIEFHFILAFATESYDNNGKGMGKFCPSWDREAFKAENIKKLKDKHPNVKVVISIGGRGSIFNADNKQMWNDNAVRTLKEIIVEFKNVCQCNLIDGIDVNYEKIESTEEVFVESIGDLIKELKEDGTIKVVSIAPSKSVRPHYRTLYQIKGDYIDWVDYRFYDQEEPIPTRDDFVRLYRDLRDDFQVGKLLAGFKTEDPANIQQQVFLDGCTQLLQSQLISGIFVWNAEASRVANWNDPFQFEVVAQRLLVQYQ